MGETAKINLTRKARIHPEEVEINLKQLKTLKIAQKASNRAGKVGKNTESYAKA